MILALVEAQGWSRKLKMPCIDEIKYFWLENFAIFTAILLYQELKELRYKLIKSWDI